MGQLELTGVAKRFGAKQVLTDLSMHVPAGSIYGFVGANGAGKTTTMRLILGLDTLDAGTIRLAGDTRTPIGYLPDVPEYYGYMTPREYLTLCGQVAGLRGGELRTRCGELLQTVDLPDDRRRIHGFSRGMKQRLGIAQALLGHPALLICDEPTSALDPEGRSEFLTLLASLRGETTVLFSTHILSDVERIADHVGILAQGHLQVEGNLAQLKTRFAQPRILVRFATAAAAQAAQPVLGGRVVDATVTLAASADVTMSTVLAKLAATQADPVAITRQATSLEDIYMAVTK
ncbi:ABC transporter ATP-binding protein [Lacticaseibacillus daqingensis]|uniref:ABC transporter ATP-binding protein n=1 Tax=Lacticaseibacillus daqingensis TaxID=2486014 RepID=UPI000F76CA21|nr:ABC transporter ATP-binding protein [Lacticaseibacillus daqingensis]